MTLREIAPLFVPEGKAPWHYLRNVSAGPGSEGAPAVAGDVSRRRLEQLLDSWRPWTGQIRTARCGRIRHSTDVDVHRSGEGTARARGLIRCRSKSCPVCVAERRRRDAELIERTVELWAEWRGAGSVYMATLTVRHGWDDSLEDTGHGIRRAWRALLGSRAWREFRRRHGVEAITSTEVTHGAHGWHPHLHVLVLTAGELSQDAELEVADWLYERWAALVARHIGEHCVPLPGPGTDFRQTTAGRYISKLGIELSSPGGKRSRGGSTVLGLLERWCDDRDDRARELYREYESVMRGKRDLTWTRGLRVLRQLAATQLKSERALERDAEPLICTVDGALWDEWRWELHRRCDGAGCERCKHTGRVRRVRALATLLEAAERGGVRAVRDLVTRELGGGGPDPPAWRVFGPPGD